MAIDLNLSGVERPSWKPLPEGNYTLVLSDIQVKPGKSNKESLIAHCTYEVVGNDDDSLNGRKIKYWQVLNPAGEYAELQKGFLKIWLEALFGEPIEGDVSLDEDDLVGRHVTAFIKQVPRQDDPSKINNEISYFVLPFDTNS